MPHPGLYRRFPEILRYVHSSDCYRAPAAGYRLNATGALTNVGTEGNYHSSSPYASDNHNAGLLNLNAGGVNPVNNGTRSTARPVRCVQHLPKKLLFHKTLPLAEHLRTISFQSKNLPRHPPGG